MDFLVGLLWIALASIAAGAIALNINRARRP